MNQREHNSTDWWDILSAVAFSLAMITAASRLAATGWVRNLDLVATVTLLGLFAGLALGKSIFSPFVVFLFGLSYGIFVIPWQIGLTLGVDIEWIERLKIIVERVRAILLDIILRDDVTDNLFFLLLMATLFWTLSVFTSYQLIRKGNAWLAILPGGIAIFTIHNYDPHIERRTWYLAIYLFLALLILARNYFLRENRRWQVKRTFVPPDAGFDFGRFAMLMTMIIVFMAWNSPALADSLSPVANLYRMIEAPWLDAKERMSFLFASLRATVGLVSDYYGAEQPLGRGNVNNDSDVMEIVAPRSTLVGYRYYWRARVYDNYASGRWTSTIDNPVDFSPAREDFLIPDEGEREIVDVEITPQSALLTLYAPPQPVWYSRFGELNAFELVNGAYDVAHMEARPFIRPGETYQVRSSITLVTQKDLREAGTDYPQWVLDRYLQVPEEITPRTRLLAERLAEGRENPFEIVSAVNFWLRENIEYVELIDEIPSDQEPLDWFLFESQKGFCNYYSTAMIMLLRSVGIPARWAVGYAQGSPQIGQAPEMPNELRGQVPEIFFSDIEIYRVKQFDAHSWPEVYFPGIGWVEFEPTVSQSPLLRPLGEEINLDDLNANQTQGARNFENLPLPDDFPDSLGGAGEVPVESSSTSEWIFRVFLISIGVILLVVALVVRRYPDAVQRIRDRIILSLKTPFPVYLESSIRFLGFNPPSAIRRMAYQATLPPVAKSFLEISRALVRLDSKPELSATPSEQVHLLVQKLPSTQDAAQTLLHQYHLETYSTKEIDVLLSNRAGDAIRRLSIQFWFEMILTRITNPFQGRPQPRGRS